MTPEELQILINVLTIKALWLVAGWIVYRLFERIITRAIEGYFFHAGRDFDLDDEIMIDGQLGRMVRYGLLKTVFYVYTIDVATGIVMYADKLPVSNEHLRTLKITKAIKNHDRKELLIETRAFKAHV